MGLFSALVKTVIETAKLPVNAVKDAASLGGALTGTDSFTGTGLKRIKEAASDKDEEEMTKEEDLIP